LDGYDEISLTGDFKVITNAGEQYYSIPQLGFNIVPPASLASGETINEAADTFLTIISNKGNDIQNNVVLTNAAFAIKTFDPEKTFADCFNEAEESLRSGRALN